MSNARLIVLALVAAVSCSSCSLSERWGSETPRLVDRQRVTLGGKEFVVSRFLVDAKTGETFTESLQVVNSQPVSRTDIGIQGPR
jgi:hypothetical protein